MWLRCNVMKKLKTLFTILIIITLFSGLAYRSINKNPQTEETRFLFDTVCSITVFSPSAGREISAAFDAAAEIHRLTDFYDKASDVARINSAKANTPVAVSRETAEIIDLAQKIHTDSKGAFDICLAPVSQLWNFKSQAPAIPQKPEIEKALELCKNSKITVDMTDFTVAKNHSDAQIDLGGIAKGYAADAAARVLEEMGVKAAILDFGGNIVVVGKNPKTSDGKWRIGLQTPFAPTGEYSKIVEIQSGSTVTSGTYQRYFEADGNMYHHIIDPQNGFPAQKEYKSVSISAQSSALADALATAVFVLGKKDGAALAEKWGAVVEFL